MNYYPTKLNYIYLKGLANVPYYIEGEYYWSFLGRVAIENGFENTISFLNFVLSKNRITVNDISFIFDIIDKKSYDFVKLSCSSFAASFLLSGKVLNNLIYSAIYDCHLQKDSKEWLSTKGNLKVCPLCHQKDVDNGISHYHTVHQLPGVNICPYHSVPLLTMNCNQGDEFSDPRSEAIVNNIDLKTAVFMKDIYLSSFIGSRKTTVYAILEKLKSRYGVYDKKSVITNLFKDKELASFSVLKKYLYDSLNDGQKPFLDVDYTVRFVAAIFKDANEFIELASERDSYEEKIFDDICLDVFNRISHYNSGLVSLKCQCGKIFIANPDLISRGIIGCPYCNAHVRVRNSYEYESARNKSILEMMPEISNRKIDSIQDEILTIVDTEKAKVYEVEAFKYLKDNKLENETMNVPTPSNLNEYRKLDEIYIRPVGIREGVPICDSLRFYLGLTTSVGNNSVALFKWDYINDRHFFYKEGIRANVFTLRGNVTEKDWLLKAFLATLHFYSYTTSWTTATALELACKVKLLGITPEVLKGNDINLFESDCREAENLLRRV